MNNPQTGLPWFDNTNYIAFRTWDNDPTCGIRDNKVVGTQPYQECDVRGVRNNGRLVNYSPADNNCPSVNNAPLDRFIPLSVLIFGGLGFVTVRRKRLILIESTNG